MTEIAKPTMNEIPDGPRLYIAHLAHLSWLNDRIPRKPRTGRNRVTYVFERKVIATYVFNSNVARLISFLQNLHKTRIAENYS